MRASHVWKRFRPRQRRLLLRDEVQSLRTRARTRGQDQERWQWALRDIGFEVSPGEAVGLIGANGSGKSTLLKILTRVMYPYAGHVDVAGRVGALIEVRAGIHPDLTGRENVYLYGSLLGLPRRRVAERFDAIIEFAELEDAVDRQVKFYSSGMQMRLGFAVAAFLEPNVLLVDEVLAVGDAAFQQRCLDRMRTLVEQGTTLIFVSHDLPTVEATCQRAVWLRHGVVEADGPIKHVLDGYRRSLDARDVVQEIVGAGLRLTKAAVFGPDGANAAADHPVEIELSLDSEQRRRATLHVGVTEGTAAPIFTLQEALELHSGETTARCRLPSIPLPGGRFALWIAVLDDAGHELVHWQQATQFDVLGAELEPSPRGVVRLSPVHVQATWDVAPGGAEQ